MLASWREGEAKSAIIDGIRLVSMKRDWNTVFVEDGA